MHFINLYHYSFINQAIVLVSRVVKLVTIVKLISYTDFPQE